MHSEHDARVQAIVAALVAERDRPGPLHLDKGGVHHFVPLPGDRRFAGRAIDLSKLTHVLAIDRERRVATAEPGVTFAALIRETLRHGLLPKVVPELEGITVGGAIAGCSVESMSYRYGGFHDGCREYELVTTGGEVLTVSPEREPLLFHMTHGSYGTLGILTKATFDLVPAKPFVRVEYVTKTSIEDFVAELSRRVAAEDFDFIDGIVHGPRQLVLCLGRFVDSAPRASSYRGVDIYYKSTAVLREDILSTEDYCFRYDTECHWLTRTVPPLEWRPVRRAIGKHLLGSTNLIRWSNRLAPLLKVVKRRPDVVVDVFIPSPRFPEFLEWYVRDYAFYPLWIVPYRVPAPYPWVADRHAQGFGSDLMIDCAVYGKVNDDPASDASEVLEKKTYALGGIKTLISRNHHTEAEFWSVYHRENYQAAKARLDPAKKLPGLYEKFHRGR